MKTFIRLKNLTHGYGDKPLIKDGALVINKGDKVCLLGRNGMGKSTLLKIIAKEIDPDVGEVELQSGLKVGMLMQSVPAGEAKTVFDVIAEDQPDLQNYEIERVISRLHLDATKNFNELSGGLKRRVLLAKALVEQPDVLLLDEPTNHLDIDSIEWLESFLKNYSGTIILVSHDRGLMQTVGNYFVEIDHGNLIEFRGSYTEFLKHKEYTQNAEASAQAAFDKKLAQEEVWIRQGIKARRTRNEGRVRALKKMRQEFKDRQQKIGTVKLSQQATELSGKEVLVAENISFSYDEKPIIKDFSCIIQRGDKVGILGPNGAGKSTLIKLLLKQLEPISGHVKHGTKLDIVYFDQHRQALDWEKTIFDNVCEGSDFIEIAGKRTHIMSYLQNFLFSPERIRTPVKSLSGGERNRVLLAKLFMKPANLMILDEPTNDLDIETLELLEEQLMDFKGTVLLVSHDRSFINNIVTQTIVFEGDGKLQNYAGGYDDWLFQRKQEQKKQTKVKTSKKPEMVKSSSNKLTYKERLELKDLPKMIETLEEKASAQQAQLADPDFYQSSPEVIAEANKTLAETSAELEVLYSRWEELEQRS